MESCFKNINNTNELVDLAIKYRCVPCTPNICNLDVENLEVAFCFVLFCFIALEQWMLGGMGVVLHPKGHLTMSGDILSYWTGEDSATII